MNDDNYNVHPKHFVSFKIISKAILNGFILIGQDDVNQLASWPAIKSQTTHTDSVTKCNVQTW